MDNVNSLLNELASSDSVDLVAGGGINTSRFGRSNHCHRSEGEHKIYTQCQEAGQDGGWLEEENVTLFKADGPFIQVRWPNCVKSRTLWPLYIPY